MQSKTSYFNKTVFFGTIARFWPIWVIYLAVWLVIMPLSLSSTMQYTWTTAADVQYQVLNFATYGGTVMSAIFCALAAMAAFGFMYNNRSANAYASLPIPRGGMFLSNALAGIVCLLAANVITFVVSLLVEASYGMLDVGYLLQWLAIVSMLNIFFYSFAVLVGQFTGHSFGLPLIYFLLNFAVIGAEVVVRSMLKSIVYGMSSTGFALSFLSPIAEIFSNCGPLPSFVWAFAEDGVTEIEKLTHYYFNGWATVGIYCGVGLLLIVAAALLYKHRHMEAASDVIAVKPMRPVFKYCFALGMSLLIGAALYSTVDDYSGTGNAGLLVLFLVIGAFVGYFAAEMLLRKSFRVFRHGWGGFAVTAIVVALFFLANEYDLFGYERHVPDSSSVATVSISASGENIELASEEGIKSVAELHRSVIENKNYYEQTMEETWNQYHYDIDVLAGEEYTYWTYVQIDYSLKNGELVSRQYQIPYDNSMISRPDTDIAAINVIFNTKEAVDYRKSTDIAVTEQSIIDAYIEYYDDTEYRYSVVLQLSAEEAYELYTDCILPDIEDGALGRVWIGGGPEYEGTVYDCRINLDLAEKGRDGRYSHDYFYTYPTVDSLRTNEWLEERGITLITHKERYAQGESYGTASAEAVMLH